MNTAKTLSTLSINSDSPSKTESVANNIGQHLRGGEVIELISDLGGGKTTFVRGLAAGLGSSDKVASPSFTISRIYKSPKLELHHYDFYRLHESGITGHEIAEDLGGPNIVVVVEWADVVQSVLPQRRLTIHINKTVEDRRQLQLTFPSELNYLVGGL